jgi:6-phosphofructokinase 1
MSDSIKTIGVLTSGGDAPGMNAAIRAVVRTGIANGLKVKGIRRGYAGLLEEDIVDMGTLDVSDIIQTGGTILYTARCLEFKKEEYQKKGAEICKKHGIDGVVVIGGDGSFNGASKLSANGINTIGVPGTIDLDIACTEYTIGFDTAINTAMEAIDKLRDTSESHERCSIVEVMGRTAGHIALWTGIASGAEYILTTEEYHGDIQRIINKIQDRRRIGKKNHIIVNAEGVGNSYEMAKVIEIATGVETRATVLGHIQRGGNPTCKDRVFASAMGAKAVELLCEGKSNRVVGYRDGEFVDYDIQEALAMEKGLDPYLSHITRKLTTR